MLRARNSDNNIGLWHDTPPAYLYRYANWNLQQEVKLLAAFATKRTALSVKVLHKFQFDIQSKSKVHFVTCRKTQRLSALIAQLSL